MKQRTRKNERERGPVERSNEVQDRPPAMPQSGEHPTGATSQRGENTMATRRSAPGAGTPSGPRLARDTRLEPVYPTHMASSRATVRVLIANQQPIVRHGLWDVIAREPDLQVVGETDDGREAMRLARQLRPDVVLIDLLMPIVDGI